MNVEMQGVDSSNIDAVGYDADRKKLVVRFKNGGVYEYDSDLGEYQALVGSSSVGGYFHRNIKGRAFTKLA